MAKNYDGIIGWITRGGKHIPLRKGSDRAKAKANKEFEKGHKELVKADKMEDFGKATKHYQKMYDQVDKYHAKKKKEQIKDAIKADRSKKKAEKEYDKALKKYEKAETMEDFGKAGKHVDKAKKHLDEYYKKKDKLESIKSGIKNDRERGRTDTKDIIAEIKSGKHNSAEEHLAKDGFLKPAREGIHDGIIDKVFEGKESVKGQGVMTMLGGGSASGKSHLQARESAEGDKNSVILDPDAFKEALPGYSSMAKVTDKAAGYYHEESSALNKRAYQEALEANYNVVYDGTGDGSVASATKKIQQARAKGYKVNGEYATVEIEEALKRNQKRYEDALARGDDARLPDPELVRAIHKNVTNVAIQTAHLYDDFKLYDNNVPFGEPMILIATGGNGKGIKAVKGREKELERFLKKGDIDFIIEDGIVIPLVPKK